VLVGRTVRPGGGRRSGRRPTRAAGWTGALPRARDPPGRGAGRAVVRAGRPVGPWGPREPRGPTGAVLLVRPGADHPVRDHRVFEHLYEHDLP